MVLIDIKHYNGFLNVEKYRLQTPKNPFSWLDES